MCLPRGYRSHVDDVKSVANRISRLPRNFLNVYYLRGSILFIGNGRRTTWQAIIHNASVVLWTTKYYCWSRAVSVKLSFHILRIVHSYRLSPLCVETTMKIPFIPDRMENHCVIFFNEFMNNNLNNWKFIWKNWIIQLEPIDY